MKSISYGIALSAAVFLLPITAAQAYEMHVAPSAGDVKSRATTWADEKVADDETRKAEVEQIWANLPEAPSPQHVFDKLIETFCAVDEQTAEFVAACSLADSPLIHPEPDLLMSEDVDELYRSNLLLFYGRYLAQRRMYDEALSALTRIDPAAIVDPATYYFFTAVCQHQLLKNDEALASLDELLENTGSVPQRYSTVAELMRYDLAEYSEKSLSEVSRKMEDSERRLDLGRGGQRVQKVQSEIVATLDEIIKKLEQQSSGGGGASGQGQSNRSESPADDSRVKGSTAPGEIDERKLTQEGNWGAMPPKEETRAKNLINENFPAHYRDAVEKYFKKLAQRRADSGN